MGTQRSAYDDEAQDGHVGHYAHNAEALAVRLDGFTQRRLAIEKALARRLADHRDEIGVPFILGRERAALQELEVEDLPDLAVRAPQLGLDLAAPGIGDHRLGGRDDGNLFDRRQRRQWTYVAVEESVARVRVHRHVGSFHRYQIDAQRAVAAGLRSMRRQGVIEDGGRHHQHQQGEADPEQADEREELPPRQDLQGHFQIVFDHREYPPKPYCTCRPSNRRTVRCVRSARRGS